MRQMIIDEIAAVSERHDRHRSESLRTLRHIAQRFNACEARQFNLRQIDLPPELPAPSRSAPSKPATKDRRYLQWSKRERLLAASHEIGHAITAECVGAPVRSVRLGSGSQDLSTSGETHLDGLSSRHVEDRLAVHVAGMVGEQRLTGQSSRTSFGTGPGDCDTPNIVASLRAMGVSVRGGDLSRNSAVREATERVEAFLGQHHRAFNALVQMLATRGELTGSEVRTVMNAYVPKAASGRGGRVLFVND